MKAVLNDQMGLDKTCQILHSLMRLKKHLPDPKFVILVEKRILNVWEHELSKFIDEENRTWFDVDSGLCFFCFSQTHE